MGERVLSLFVIIMFSRELTNNMNLVYIKNYLKIPIKKRFDFLKVMNCCQKFKVITQSKISNGYSIFLEFSEDSDIEFAILNIKNFFENEIEIEIKEHKESLITNNFKL